MTSLAMYIPPSFQTTASHSAHNCDYSRHHLVCCPVNVLCPITDYSLRCCHGNNIWSTSSSELWPDHVTTIVDMWQFHWLLSCVVPSGACTLISLNRSTLLPCYHVLVYLKLIMSNSLIKTPRAKGCYFCIIYYITWLVQTHSITR